MKKISLITSCLMAAVVLSGCVVPYRQGPNTVIARGYDGGLGNKGVLADGGGGIAYDPDGCQGWILDDGIEGYSGRRFDPVSGLPVCDNLYPPGTVLRNYQSTTSRLKDRTPTSGINQTGY